MILLELLTDSGYLSKSVKWTDHTYPYLYVTRRSRISRAARSPLEPRAIVVRMPNARQEDRSQQAELFKQLDWAAIKKMVN